VTTTSTTLPGGPDAAWGFDEGTDARVLDVSGNGNHGSLAGASWTASGRFGAALVFDGVDDRVSVPDAPSLDASLAVTVEAWIRPSRLDAGYGVIVDKTTTGQPSNYYLATLQDELVFGFWADGEWREHATAGLGLAVGAWQHVAAVYDDAADRVRLYVGASEVLSAAEPASLEANDEELRIGVGFPGEAFAGAIDEVRVYRRALTPAEIRADADAPVRPVPVDDRPPVLTDGRPTGTLAAGTTAAILSVRTDESATCRWAATPGIAHAAMPNAFATTGGTEHATPLGGLAAGGPYAHYVRCRDASGNVNDADYVIAFAVAGDITPPTVAFVAPAAGATLSGTVAITVAAADDVGVAGVQLLVDGVATAWIGVPPWTQLWDTRATADGAHVLEARAVDAAGNVGTASIAVVVANANVGLVAAYGFEETSGTVAVDASGNGNTGSLVGPLRTTNGRFGRALLFDGVNDLVRIADAASLDLDGALTVEAWVYPTTPPSGWRTIVAKEGSAGSVYFLHAASGYGDAPAGGVSFGGAERTVAGPARLASSAWTHLAATYDGTRVRLWVNGNSVAETLASGPVDVSTGALRLGGNAPFGEYFQGRIDEVRLYRRALSETEIRNDMLRPVGP
jgi:hypothetical protein